MKIEPLAGLPHPEWLRMRRTLWPDAREQEHLAEMQSFVAQPGRFARFIALSNGGTALGFVEASIRSDHVSGTRSSPVGPTSEASQGIAD